MAGELEKPAAPPKGVGVEMDGRLIKINDNYQTNIPSVYAIGLAALSTRNPIIGILRDSPTFGTKFCKVSQHFDDGGSYPNLRTLFGIWKH